MPILRKATQEDEQGIRSCAENAYTRYVAAIGRKPVPMIADFATQISKEHAYVAVNNAQIVEGFIVFFQRDGHMFLENVAVQPSAAGKGIGKSLIKFCETEAVRLNLKSVQLYTNEKMIDNLSIYPYLGYLEIERRVEDGFNRVYFEKRLS